MLAPRPFDKARRYRWRDAYSYSIWALSCRRYSPPSTSTCRISLPKVAAHPPTSNNAWCCRRRVLSHVFLGTFLSRRRLPMSPCDCSLSVPPVAPLPSVNQYISLSIIISCAACRCPYLPRSPPPFWRGGTECQGSHLPCACNARRRGGGRRGRQRRNKKE